MPVKSLTTDACEILAPAKINLFLQVLNKRPDGYHNINSLMQAVALFDELKFTKISEPVCQVQLIGAKAADISDNLISRAYNLMKSNFNLKSGVEVSLEKNIPIAAGLGGGSSDCAAALMALNLLFNLGLDKSAMVDMAIQLGSDVPFFFSKGQALVTGRGEKVQETSFPMGYKIVLVSPPFSASTKEGYLALKRDLTCPDTPFNIMNYKSLEGYLDWLSEARNDFEKVQFNKNPILGEIKEKLVNCGAEFARMSGSGPTIFGIFPNAIDTERACANNFADCQLYTVAPFCVP